MATTLSTADLAGIQACSRELLSVLEDPDIEAWAARVISCAQPLLRAERMFLAIPSRNGFVMYRSDPEMQQAALSYMEHYHKADVYVGPRRRALGLDVYSFDMLITPAEQRRSEFWNDWILGYRMYKPAGVSRDVRGYPVPATLMAYGGSPTDKVFGERELGILGLLKPSFDAAVGVLQRFQRAGNDLVAHVDNLPTPVLLVGRHGVHHANPAFTNLMGGAARDFIAKVVPHASGLLLPDRRDAVSQLCGEAPGPRGISIPWSACVLWCGGNRPFALVHCGLSPACVVSETTRERLGLSGRQAEVAQLMAERFTYTEIATRLGIRPNTARRHCEQVLQRLGLHSRLDVRALLVRVASDVEC